MANGSIPETWIGQAVNVSALTVDAVDPETQRGTLTVASVNGLLGDANRKGILILHPGEDTNQQTRAGTFFPWGAVLEIAG